MARRSDLFVPKGDPATMPIEITDAAVLASEGVLKKGQVIAQHSLRASEAVVLLDDAAGLHGSIPKGTALAKVTTLSRGALFVLWCDTRPTHRLLFVDEHDCLGGHERLGPSRQAVVGRFTRSLLRADAQRCDRQGAAGQGCPVSPGHGR